MKKILYVTTVNSTINAFLVPHIRSLIEQGYKVDCAANMVRELDKNLVELGVRFFNIPFTRNPLDIKNANAYKKLLKIQEKEQYEVIHVHTPIAALYGRLLKLKFPKLKTIYTAHGFHFYKGAPKVNWIIYYTIERIMAKLTDVIITMNEEDYNAALKFNIKYTHRINGVGLELNKYNPNLFNKNKVRERLELKESDFVILMIAEVNKNKNHIQMIKAVEILKNKGIEVKVLCAGRGTLIDKLRLEIQKRNLESNIFMLGFRNDIQELISACDIGILLSYREGLPRNIMELMANGKPVIGTNIRGIRDLINDDRTGFLVDVGDYENTANKILELYNNRELVNYMAANCYEAVKPYGIENVIKQINYVMNI